MSSKAVAQKGDRQIYQPDTSGDIIEEREASAKASAQAGLNLNIFGAISGIFSGKSSKKTEADGSSVEEQEQNAHVKGAGAGNLNAAAAGNAEQYNRHTKAIQ